MLAMLFYLTIHSTDYTCDLRESSQWNTDMVICWPTDFFTADSQGVMRFWRENPDGVVGELPCEGNPGDLPE